MSPSLSLCVIAGFLWAGVGVAYSLTSKRGVHPASMLFVVSGCALLAVLPWCRWATDNESGWTERVELIKWMALSGVANWAGLITMQLAMARGRAGLAWAMGQSAPLIPLVIAIVAHGERPSVTA